MVRHFSALLLILITITHSSFAVCNKSGIYKIGPGGDYLTLTAALTDLKSTGTAGPVVFELKVNYTGSGEVFPLFFNNIPCISAANTVTVRPEAGSAGLVLQNNGTVINLSMSRYIIIDGRPGGVGTTIALQLSGGGNAPTISFLNDASHNIIQYVSISGSVNNANSGVVSFTASNQSFTNGNSNNVITHCSINGNNGSVNGVYSAGSAGKKNAYNIISHCDIVGFRSSNPSTPASAVRLKTNSTHWSIDSNQIYLPGAIAFSADIPVHINDTTSNGFYVRGNYIGGSAPQCGGNPVSYYGGSFTGIFLACSNAGYSSIQGNTIANIQWSNSYSQQYFAGIHIAAGAVNCGTTHGNTIGSLTQNYSIATSSYYLTSPEVYGILVYSSFGSYGTLDSVEIRNNLIGGIQCQPGTNNYLGTPLRGIAILQQQEGHVTISNNTIGSAALDKSLYSTVAMGEYATIGIYVQVMQTSSTAYTYPIANIISGNTLRNLYGSVTGIHIEGGVPVIKGNVITNLADGVPGSISGTAVVVGISGALLTPGSVIVENRIFNCRLYGQYAASVNGIVIENSEGVDISKNFIHTFMTEGDYIPTTGIAVYSSIVPFHGKHRINNNMIRFGLDTTGNLINQSAEITGILAQFDSSFISHNSLYLNGTGDGDTRCIYVQSSHNNYTRISNNIMVNLRNQQTVNNWFRNTALGFDKVFNVPLAGLSISNNIYQVSNAAGNNVVVINNTPFTSLSAWQAFSGLDNNSLTGNPLFQYPNGSISTMSLHVSNNSIADMAGTSEPLITHDFDNEIRSLFTPVDIGADAFNGTTTGFDIPNGADNDMLIYPNPAGDYFILELDEKTTPSSIILMSMDGKHIQTETIYKGNRLIVSTSRLLNGLYQVVVQTDHGIMTQKVIIQNQ